MASTHAESMRKCKLWLVLNEYSVLAVSGSATLIGVWCCQYIQTPGMFITVYALVLGVGKGIMYSTVLDCAISHLMLKKGTVSGFVISGYGFGSFLWGILA